MSEERPGLEHEASPESPEREKPAEGEVTPEGLLEEADGLNDLFDEAPAEFRAESMDRLGKIVGGSETSVEDRAAMPEFDAAMRDLGGAQRDADRLSSSFKGKLRRLSARAKRLGHVALAAMAISAAAGPEAAHAAEKPQGQGIERVEKAPKAPEQVRREAVERAMANQALRKEFADRYGSPEQGEARLKELCETLGSWDEKAVMGELAKLGGLSAQEMERRLIKEIFILSDAEIKDKSVHPDMTETANAMTEDGRVYFRASAFADAKGVDAAKLRHTATHEGIHAAANTHKDYISGHMVNPWAREGVPHDVIEATTEALASRVDSDRGVRTETGYAAGTGVAGQLLMEAVGAETLAKAYLRGDHVIVEDALDARFGKGMAEKVMTRDFAELDAPEGLSAAFDLVQAYRGAGKEGELRAALDGAKSRGMAEQVELMPGGIAVLKEVGGELKVANAVLEDDAPVSERGSPVRVVVHTTGKGVKFDNPWTAGEEARSIYQAGELADTAYAETMKEYVAAGVTDLKDASTAKAFEDAVKFKKKEMVRQRIVAGGKVADDDFNVVLRFDGDPLLEAYKGAKDGAEKGRVRADVLKRLEDQGRAAIKDLRLELQTPPIPKDKK